MDILIAVPTYENISPETFKSIYDLEKSQGVNLEFEFVKGYDCARARNLIVQKTLDGNYDAVLMVDSDIILPKHAILCLADDQKDIVLGYSPRKDTPSISEIYKHKEGYNKNERYYVLELRRSPISLLLIDGGSFGCTYISKRALNKLAYPYFLYLNNADGTLLSEDLYFCSKAREAGIDIYVDTRLHCKHIAKHIVE